MGAHLQTRKSLTSKTRPACPKALAIMFFIYLLESYAPFQSMSVRESFLTINDGVAAAPGPGHYSPLKNSSAVKGGCSLGNKVSLHYVTAHT